jgi:hypothetical protein
MEADVFAEAIPAGLRGGNRATRRACMEKLQFRRFDRHPRLKCESPDPIALGGTPKGLAASTLPAKSSESCVAWNRPRYFSLLIQLQAHIGRGEPIRLQFKTVDARFRNRGFALDRPMQSSGAIEDRKSCL